MHRKTWRAGVSEAVHNSTSPRMGRVCSKRGACGRSRAAVAAYNDKLAKRNATLVLNANFLPGDGNVTLVYPRGSRPLPEEAAVHWKAFADAMRAAARAAGVEFRFMHAIGVGVKGAVHHHLVVNRECLPFLQACFPWGAVHVGYLYQWQNYQKLAGYFCGQDKGENPDDPRQILIHGNRYSTSRNLRRPEAEREALEDEAWETYPEPGPQRLVDIESIDVGENPVNGQPYQFYITLPLAAPAGLAGRRRAEWAEQELAKNRALVRWKVDRQLAEMEERKLRWRARDEAG